jgi:hypothetical protein
VFPHGSAPFLGVAKYMCLSVHQSTGWVFLEGHYHSVHLSPPPATSVHISC